MKICYIQALHDRGFSEDLIAEFMQQEHSVVHYRYVTRKTAVAALDLPEYSHFQNSNLMLRSPLFFKTRIENAARAFIRWFEQSGELHQVIYTHFCFSDGWLAYRANLQFGIPYVVAFRNEDMNAWYYWSRPDMTAFRNLILTNASAIVFINACYVDKLCDRLPKNMQEIVRQKASVVTNGINDFWYRNKRGYRHALDRSSVIRLLTVGDINSNKNQRTVVNVVRALRKKGFRINYAAVGKMKDKSVSKYLSNCEGVEIVPYANREKLLQLYDNADIYVMPSIHETFGLTYIEAMSRGMPVIYSHGEGISGLFNEGLVGYGVNSKSIHEIAEAIEKIINNYQQMSKDALLASQDFCWGKAAKKLMTIFEKDV